MSVELWQAELRSLVVGEGTSYEISGPIGGLGLPKPRTFDAPRGDRTGEVGGADRLLRRIVTIPLNLDGAVAEILGLRDELVDAWQETDADETLDLYLPGMSTPRRFFGRARGADVDLDDLKSGHAGALCTFEALDPFGYEDEIDVEAVEGTFTIDNPGRAPTDRIVATITGDGGTPRLEIVDGGFVQFVDVVGAGDEILLDFRNRLVVDELLVARWALIANASPWFELVFGENELELSGAASVAITYRPAFR